MPSPARRALITGVTGQDGSYLVEFLLRKGYEVHGLIRRSSTFNTSRLDEVYQDPHHHRARLLLHYGDLTDANVLARLMRSVRPDEIYNLGAQSHVRVSFDMPIYTAETVAVGALKLLETVREYRQDTRREIRYYQASSSEMFGKVRAAPQDETTPFHPRSPYGCAKLMAHAATINYREAYGLHASCGILFNHESPRRGETFVTRKITRGVGRIRLGLQKRLFLGNLDAKRDWGYAGDYVESMWLMLQQERADDYVIATGETHSVREFCQAAFAEVGLDWKKFVALDPRYLRPAEVDLLLGDASHARARLGWQPRVRFRQLVKMMVQADLKLAQQEKTLREAGHILPPGIPDALDGDLIGSTLEQL